MGEDMKAQFWERGWCVARGLLRSADLDPVRSVIERSVAKRSVQLQREGHIAHTHAHAPFDQRWALVAADAVAAGATFREGNWGQVEMLDRAIYELLVDRRLTDLASSLLSSPDLMAHGDYWVRPCTKAVAASGVPFHQDSTYYAENMDPVRAAAAFPPLRAQEAGSAVQLPSERGIGERVGLTLWLPIVDSVDESNGCLRFVNASHRLGLLPCRPKPGRPGALEPLEPPSRYGAVEPVPMRCGDVLAFHHNTMHGSEGFSRERHVRWSIDLRYGPAGQPFDWHGDPFWLEKWPPFRARAANPDECVDTWEQWEARWRNPHQLAAAL